MDLGSLSVTFTKPIQNNRYLYTYIHTFQYSALSYRLCF
jgi:hypothetical protein